MIKLRFLAPFILFLLILFILGRGLSLHANLVPSPLVNKPAPHFALPDLFNSRKVLTHHDLTGRVILLNVWASWCYSCAEENPFLLYLANNKHVLFYGLNYKDEQADAKQWLHDHGNPYQRVFTDSQGKTAIDWGVYGTPETFVIDKKGVIRYKQTGPLTEENWQQVIAPLMGQLEQE